MTKLRIVWKTGGATIAREIQFTHIGEGVSRAETIKYRDETEAWAEQMLHLVARIEPADKTKGLPIKTTRRPGLYETTYGNTAEYYGPDEPAFDLDSGEEIPTDAVEFAINWASFKRSLE